MSYLVDLRDGVATGMRAVRRIGPGAVVLRSVVFAAGLAGMALALPSGMEPWTRLLVAALVGLLPALGPGSWTVTAMELVTVVTWVLRPMAAGAPSTWGALVVLAALLYLHHSASALAAAVPMDTALAMTVWTGWLRRLYAVIGVTVLLAACGLLLASWVGIARTVVVPVVGVLAALVVGWLLSRSLRR